MKDLTLLIKTFERPDCLDRLLRSIRKFYPDIPVLVADDSWTPYAKAVGHGIGSIILPANVGLSAGRNALVKRANTELVCILDDDFVFTKETRLELLAETLKKEGADLVAGAVRNKGQIRHYEGDFIEKEGRLFFLRRPAIQPTRMDIVFNFFVAKREVLIESPWDERYKMAEHAPFFWEFKQAGRVTYYHPGVVVDHHQIRSIKIYNKHRSAFLDDYERRFASQFPRGIWMAENGNDAQPDVQRGRRECRGQITGIISTICRPELLEQFVESWQDHIGDPLVIVDQSREWYAKGYSKHQNIEVVRTAWDIGGCQGYNLALEHVKTRFYALMEDDFLLTEDSDLFLLASIISMTPYDLIAGQLTRLLPDGGRQRQEYRGTFYWPRTGHLDVRWVEWDNPHHVALLDIVQNFYVADAEAVREAGGWAKGRKICDHLGFYLRLKRAGKVVGYCPAIHAHHDKRNPNPPEYARLRRGRLQDARQHFLMEEGLDLVTGAEKMVRE